MYEKDFDNWGKYKKSLQKRIGPDFSRRQIWWTAIGVNLGDESDGKNFYFERPVLILKKMSQNLFLGVPMTTAESEGDQYIRYDYVEGLSFLMLHQARVFSRKRLLRKVHRMGEDKFLEVQEKFKGMFKDVVFRKEESQIEMPSYDGISRTTFVEDKLSITTSQNLSRESIWFGTIIGESLEDDRILNKFKINKFRITEEEKEENRWHMYDVELSEKEIGLLSIHLKRTKYYANFWNLDKRKIVFHNKIFEYSKGDHGKVKEIIDYGLTQDIPLEQLDFDTIN